MKDGAKGLGSEILSLIMGVEDRKEKKGKLCRGEDW